MSGRAAAARKGSRSPATHLAVPDSPSQGRLAGFHSPPFRQSKPGRAPRKILDGKDDVDYASLPASPQPAVEISPPRRAETTTKIEPASSKASALIGNWVKSEHDGLLTLHDGSKRWYHCEVCDYRNDRLYHSKMHYLRIHVNNGKSMPRKRKYADGPAGPSSMGLPTAPPRKVQSAEAPRAEHVLGVKFATPAKTGKKTGTTPPSSVGSPSKRDTGKPRQRLDFNESQKGDGAKSRRIGRNVKLFEKDKCASIYPHDSSWSAENAQMLHFGEGSIVCEKQGGSGWSVNVGGLNSHASLPPGRLTIGAQGSLRGYKKTPKKPPRSIPVKCEEETSAPQHEDADANWAHDQHPFEHSDGATPHGAAASTSSLHAEGSLSKAMVTPGCSPMRPSSVREMGGILHTPLSAERLRLMSASPEKYRNLRSNDTLMLPPTSNALDMVGRSPCSSRRTTRAGSQDLLAALHCNETMGDGDFGLGDLEAIDNFSASQVCVCVCVLCVSVCECE